MHACLKGKPEGLVLAAIIHNNDFKREVWALLVSPTLQVPVHA